MNPYDSTPTTPAMPKKRRRWITPTVAAGTLVAGFAIGSGASGVATAEAPEPEVITEVETVTETVEVVPAACLDALSSAEGVFGDAAEFSHLVSVMMTDVMVPAIEAAFYQDIAGMELATVGMEEFRADIEVIASRISASTFPIEAAQCRSAS